MSQTQGRVSAVLGPTNTGKTHYAIERMLGHRTGIIGLPLTLLAREVYDRIVAARGPSVVALVTGEERIVPARTQYWVCTTEAMPDGMGADFLAVDSKNNRLVAFGASQLYIVNPAGYVEKTFNQGYDDIPDLKSHLLSGSAVCVVYKNLASYYQGRAFGSYMVGNAWAGNWYSWWRYYFEGLYAFSGCK